MGGLRHPPRPAQKSRDGAAVRKVGGTAVPGQVPAGAEVVLGSAQATDGHMGEAQVSQCLCQDPAIPDEAPEPQTVAENRDGLPAAAEVDEQRTQGQFGEEHLVGIVRFVCRLRAHPVQIDRPPAVAQMAGDHGQIVLGRGGPVRILRLGACVGHTSVDTFQIGPMAPVPQEGREVRGKEHQRLPLSVPPCHLGHGHSARSVRVQHVQGVRVAPGGNRRLRIREPDRLRGGPSPYSQHETGPADDGFTGFQGVGRRLQPGEAMQNLVQNVAVLVDLLDETELEQRVQQVRHTVDVVVVELARPGTDRGDDIRRQRHMRQDTERREELRLLPAEVREASLEHGQQRGLVGLECPHRAVGIGDVTEEPADVDLGTACEVGGRDVQRQRMTGARLRQRGHLLVREPIGTGDRPDHLLAVPRGQGRQVDHGNEAA